MIKIKEYLKCISRYVRPFKGTPIHDWQVMNDSNWLNTCWICPDCNRKRRGISAKGYFENMPKDKTEQLIYLKSMGRRT